MRIGLLDQSARNWAAGASFTRMMLSCLELAKNGSEDNNDVEVIFLSRSEVDALPSPFKTIFVGEQPDRAQWSEAIKGADLDVIIPVRDYTVFDVDLPFVGWIPDFQHLRLPELFDQGEIDFRNQFFSAIAQKSRLILVSSESARMDFEQFFPDHAVKAHVAHFPSLLWTFDRDEDSATLRRFHLPRKFALVANQFWQHKNHRILPSALALLKRRSIDLDLVVTGLPSDYRSPENKPLSQFFQESAIEGVAGSIHFLGQVPYRDLVAIMRAAALIIQPSFFEGWSTSIEDSKALGRPLICSDISVHREQVPDALGFFDPTKPAALADLLAQIYPDLPPGPDIEREEVALELARKRAFGYGCELLEMTREAKLKELEAVLQETIARSAEATARSEEAVARSEEAMARSEEQRKYIKELESELTRLRRSNHNLRRQSVLQFVSRNIRSRWRLIRKRSSLRRKKNGATSR
jgi:glycosyltransferase involved in cell wall biosynthesis